MAKFNFHGKLIDEAKQMLKDNNNYEDYPPENSFLLDGVWQVYNSKEELLQATYNAMLNLPEME